MKISVIGAGYVGIVSAACLADSGHDVLAIDLDERKVACINDGRSPIVETGLPELIKKHIQSGKLRASTDLNSAILNTDLSLICVGTPGRTDGSLNLDYITGACRQIGAALKTKTKKHIIVNRSTVVPGTLMNVMLPILQEAAGTNFGLGNNPEFLREGTAIADYREPTQIVVGATDQTTADTIMSLYEDINAPRIICTPEIAESVKYVSNAWRASKVSFANEVGNILKTHGVDSHEVMKIFFEDTKINLGKSFLMPGFAFGGSCLPKDIRALRASANDKGLDTPIFDSLLRANEAQIKRAADLILKTGKTNIGLLGISFKPGTDDVRESPLVTLAENLIAQGLHIKIYDPCVTVLNHPHLKSCLTDAENLIGTSDAIVIGHGAREFKTLLASIKLGIPVIDLARPDPALETRDHYAGICW